MRSTALGRRPPDELLLDAGVWIAAESPGERFGSAARRVVAEPRLRTAALDLTFYEVANVIGAQRGDMAGASTVCRSIGLRCGDVLVRINADLIGASVEIALEHGLTSYDAAYVAVARRNDWTLVSTDIRDLVSQGLAVTPDACV